MAMIYRHTLSGNLYEVITIAQYTENNEKLVVYENFIKTQYDISLVWARPFDVFFGYVKTDDGKLVRRFTEVKNLDEVFTEDEIQEMKAYYENPSKPCDYVVAQNAEKYGKYLF